MVKRRVWYSEERILTIHSTSNCEGYKKIPPKNRDNEIIDVTDDLPFGVRPCILCADGLHVKIRKSLMGL